MTRSTLKKHRLSHLVLQVRKVEPSIVAVQSGRIVMMVAVQSSVFAYNYPERLYHSSQIFTTTEWKISSARANPSPEDCVKVVSAPVTTDCCVFASAVATVPNPPGSLETLPAPV